ncbi:MAG: type I-E CRISPR-associated endoribonuclease Cas2e [Acidobacteriota bacterium]
MTRNAPGRFRGFLASCMCEIAPGVYTAPRMTAGVRERVWAVLEGWYDGEDPDQAILMTWPDRAQRGGQEVRALGLPKKELWNLDGLYLLREHPTDASLASLTTED